MAQLDRCGAESGQIAAVFPAGAAVLGFISLAIGFAAAFIPFNADVKFKSALVSRQLDKMMEANRLIGSSAFHLELTLDSAIKGNFVDQSRDMTNFLINEFPKDFMGWSAKSLLSTSTPGEREAAIAELYRLDPFNPNLPKP